MAGSQAILPLSSSSPSTTVAVASCPGEKSIKVFDYETGTLLFTFADTTPPRHGLAVIGGEGASEGFGSAGDFLVTSQSKEQSLMIHKWGKPQPLFKCRTPEVLGPVVVTPDGFYCLAGGASGRIYAWDIASGSLLKTWEAHFKTVTALSLTSCGSVLLSGSEDTLVHAWILGDAIDEDGAVQDTQGIHPWRSWSEHSLPVTALYCGAGGSLCHAVSCSLDHTAKIYEVFSGDLLHTIRCPVGLWGITMSPTEAQLFMAGGDGRIFVVDMDAVAIAKTASRATVHYTTTTSSTTSAATQATKSSEGSSSSGGEPSFNELQGHKKMVNSLRCTWEGRYLLSTSEDGTLRTWDLDNLQCIKKINLDTTTPVLQVVLVSRPESLFHPPAKVPLAPLQPFKKFKTDTSTTTQGGGSGDPRGVTMFLPKTSGTSTSSIDDLLKVEGDGVVVVGEGSSGSEAPAAEIAPKLAPASDDSGGGGGGKGSGKRRR